MKKMVSGVLGGLVGLSLLPLPAQSNPAAAPAVIGACAANPAACVVVVGAGATWVLWNSGQRFYCTAYTCQRTRQSPALPRESRANNDNDLSNVKGVQEVHFVSSFNRCRDMFNRYKGDGLSDYKFIRNPQPGQRGAGWCKLLGSGARVDRFHDHRYDSDY